MQTTTNYELKKPEDNDYFNRSHQNDNMDIIDEKLKELEDGYEECFQSVSNGKELVASAITDKGVATASDATFQAMADNIGDINTGIDCTTATADSVDVLTGKTFGKGSAGSLLQVGSMSNRGAVTKTLIVNETYIIPAGYHNGLGTVSQNIPTKAATTYTPGTTNQTIASGRYLTGTQTILGDANLVAANIVSGKTIFGVTGSAKRSASGSFTVATANGASIYCFKDTQWQNIEMYAGSVSGLSFTPSIVVMTCEFTYNLLTYKFDILVINDVCVVMRDDSSSWHIFSNSGTSRASNVPDDYFYNGGFTVYLPEMSGKTVTWKAWE